MEDSGTSNHGNQSACPTSDVQSMFDNYKLLGGELENNIMQLEKLRISLKNELSLTDQQNNLLVQQKESDKNSWKELMVQGEKLSAIVNKTQSESRKDVAQKFKYVTEVFNTISSLGDEIETKNEKFNEVLELVTSETKNLVSLARDLTAQATQSGKEYISILTTSGSLCKKKIESLVKEGMKADNQLEGLITLIKKKEDEKQFNNYELQETKIAIDHYTDQVSHLKGVLKEGDIDTTKLRETGATQQDQYGAVTLEIITDINSKKSEWDLTNSRKEYLDDELMKKEESVKNIESISSTKKELKLKKAEENTALSQGLVKVQSTLQSVSHEVHTLEVEENLLRERVDLAEKAAQKEQDLTCQLADAEKKHEKMKEELSVRRIEYEEAEKETISVEILLQLEREKAASLEEEDANLSIKTELQQQKEEELWEKLKMFSVNKNSLEGLLKEKDILYEENKSLIEASNENLDQLKSQLYELNGYILNIHDERNANGKKRLFDDFIHMREVETVERLLDEVENEYAAKKFNQEINIEEINKNIHEIKSRLVTFDMFNKVHMVAIHTALDGQMETLNRQIEDIKLNAVDQICKKEDQIKNYIKNSRMLKEKSVENQQQISKLLNDIEELLSNGVECLQSMLKAYQEASRTKDSQRIPAINLLKKLERLEEKLGDPMQQLSIHQNVPKWKEPNPEIYNKLLGHLINEMESLKREKNSKTDEDILRRFIEMGLCLYQPYEKSQGFTQQSKLNDTVSTEP